MNVNLALIALYGALFTLAHVFFSMRYWYLSIQIREYIQQKKDKYINFKYYCLYIL